MNKFKSILSDNTDVALRRRAELISKNAEISQTNLINELEKERIKLENKLMSLTDLSPETTDSLKPATADFDADTWVVEIQETKQLLYDIEIQLTLARKTYKEFFEEIEEETKEE